MSLIGGGGRGSCGWEDTPYTLLLIDFFRHSRFSGKLNYAGGVTITEIELF